MGSRVNVILVHGERREILYAHNSGHGAPEDLAGALHTGERTVDAIRDAIIATNDTDWRASDTLTGDQNYPLLVVDFARGTVGTAPGTGHQDIAPVIGEWTIPEFVTLVSGDALGWDALRNSRAQPIPIRKPAPARVEPRHEFRGAKYDSARSTADIAKGIRADIKAAVASKALPSGLEVTVHTRDRSALDVAITACPGVRVNSPARLASAHGTGPGGEMLPLYTPEARALLDKVEAIVQAYNRDNSDLMTDYFDVRFYGHAGFATALVREEREAMQSMLEYVRTSVRVAK